MTPTPRRVVAIDGPAGSGKSTVARSVARRLDWEYVDTGAMYRIVCLKGLREDVSMGDEDALARLAEETDMRTKLEGDSLRAFMDGEEVTREIRSAEVNRNVSQVAELPGVREQLVEKQREMGRRGGVVMDGRDIGTVVFPDAKYKFYLEASLDIRAKRRYTELRESGDTDVTYESVVESIRERDRTDRARDNSPLRAADDAMRIDTSDRSVEEVVKRVLDEVHET